MIYSHSVFRKVSTGPRYRFCDFNDSVSELCGSSRGFSARASKLLVAVKQELFAEMSGVVNVEDGTASLHHRAVAEWLVSDRASPPLRVALSSARQAMSDAIMSWLAPVVSDQQAADTGIRGHLCRLFP